MESRQAHVLVAAAAALVLCAGCATGVGPRPAAELPGPTGASRPALPEHPHQSHEQAEDANDGGAGQDALLPAGAATQAVHAHGKARHDADAHRGHGTGHDAGHGHAPRRLLRTDLRRGWWEPPEHLHESACGVPLVHGFLTEPAFLGRDIFVDLSRAQGETELETELEWSLTRRLGLVAELPYIDSDESGIGDAAVGLRALLVEQRRFLLSASTEIELPTGSEMRGLGSGAVAIGASLHTWSDLGSWFTLQTQVGLEHVPSADELGFKWGGTLAKSFLAAPLIRSGSVGAHAHGPSAFSLLAEVQGFTPLSAGAGATEGRWLLGASYPLTRGLDFRAARSRSFGPEADRDAWTFGFLFHL